MPQVKLTDRPTTQSIYEVKQLMDDQGREIRQSILLSGEINKDIVPFVGHIVLSINTNHGVMPQPIEFPIDAEDPADAFALFDEVAEKAANDFIDAQMSKQTGIITPSG